MTFADIITEIKEYYYRCDRFTFWFALLILMQLIGFLPYPPSVLLYVAFASYGFKMFSNGGGGFCTPLAILLIYIPVGLLVVNPDPMFRSWDRFILFAFLLACVSPLVQGEEAAENRETIFRIILAVALFVGVASFFSKFAGINFGISSRLAHLDIAGIYGGITRHSMILGPVAGIGFLYSIWKGFITRSRIWWFLAVFCIGSVMFSASRSALMAALCAGTLMLYRLSGSSSKFFKTAVVLSLALSVSYPIWGSVLDGVIAKNNLNISAGGMSSSRDALWMARLDEFKKSPLLGVGFDAVDVDISSSIGGFDKTTGMVESGSSWLIILSMTGLVGGMILIPFLARTYISIFKKETEWSILICAILTLFFIHMFAEGYIYYGGSILAFLLWNTIGVAYDQGNSH